MAVRYGFEPANGFAEYVAKQARVAPEVRSVVALCELRPEPEPPPRVAPLRDGAAQQGRVGTDGEAAWRAPKQGKPHLVAVLPTQSVHPAQSQALQLIAAPAGLEPAPLSCVVAAVLLHANAAAC